MMPQSTSGGGRPVRLLRLLLLLVLALAGVEYIFSSFLDASPLKTYLNAPAIATTLSINPESLSSDRLSVPSETPKSNLVLPNHNTTVNISMKTRQSNITINSEKGSVTNKSTLALPPSTSLSKENIKKLEILSITTASSGVKDGNELPLCDKMPPGLGPISINKEDAQNLSVVNQRYPELQIGGFYTPSNCTPRHRVAIIVPYRDRADQLPIFLNHMHPFLMKQQIAYGIFIIEQQGSSRFNRAKLMNVGFVESQRYGPAVWQCFVFHDIDLLPLDERNMYSCPRQPRHMSAAVDKFKFRLPYQSVFGGVSALTTEQFKKVNGFSNNYWGWGGEDDDMSRRLKMMNYHKARYKMSIARYAMLAHKPAAKNPERFNLLSQTNKLFLADGLSSLEYDMVSVTLNHLYTHIVVNIDVHTKS